MTYSIPYDILCDIYNFYISFQLHNPFLTSFVIICWICSFIHVMICDIRAWSMQCRKVNKIIKVFFLNKLLRTSIRSVAQYFYLYKNYIVYSIVV